VYLHYVFDLWAEHWRKHHATGDVGIDRFADGMLLTSNDSDFRSVKIRRVFANSPSASAGLLEGDIVVECLVFRDGYRASFIVRSASTNAFKTEANGSGVSKNMSAIFR
jgi:hypothetical protein